MEVVTVVEEGANALVACAKAPRMRMEIAFMIIYISRFEKKVRC